MKTREELMQELIEETRQRDINLHELDDIILACLQNHGITLRQASTIMIRMVVRELGSDTDALRSLRKLVDTVIREAEKHGD